HALADDSQTVRIAAGATVVADFRLRLSPVKQEITVTASGGREVSTFESFQTVTTLETFELARKTHTSLGEVLENQPGVAKRSFGPGSARPVIRGFDGDRVLIMQDGVPTGALSSQSGDHGESIDPTSLERLEVLKGPATLLYGSNALGGVVNAVSGHHQLHEHPHQGLRGHLTAIGGSANDHAGGSAGFELGVKNWLLWGGGGAQRTGDYSTPLGTIENSATRIRNGYGGFGWYGQKRYFDLGHALEEGRYGVPFAAEIEGAADDILLDSRRHNLRMNAGFRNLGTWVDGFRLSLNYSDWRHRELEGDTVGTTFRNRQFSWRGVFDQRRTGRYSGSFGFSGAFRDYRAAGEETLAPPVRQNNFAAFALEEIELERVRLQFGARVENN
ncbi:MAG: TonB-dependent receptor plug domain-containing protein, partial [Bryobacteraceae bacterium]